MGVREPVEFMRRGGYADDALIVVESHPTELAYKFRYNPAPYPGNISAILELVSGSLREERALQTNAVRMRRQDLRVLPKLTILDRDGWGMRFEDEAILWDIAAELGLRIEPPSFGGNVPPGARANLRKFPTGRRWSEIPNVMAPLAALARLGFLPIWVAPEGLVVMYEATSAALGGDAVLLHAQTAVWHSGSRGQGMVCEWRWVLRDQNYDPGVDPGRQWKTAAEAAKQAWSAGSSSLAKPR